MPPLPETELRAEAGSGIVDGDVRSTRLLNEKREAWSILNQIFPSRKDQRQAVVHSGNGASIFGTVSILRLPAALEF